MPRVDELLDRLGNARYITTMDLTKGYWQIHVAKESQSKTAFVTPVGKFEFAFGLAGAPAVFHRYMSRHPPLLSSVPRWYSALRGRII